MNEIQQINTNQFAIDQTAAIQKDGHKMAIEKGSWKFWKKKRYIVVLMVFLGMVNMANLRASISVGIVAMTENRTVYQENGTAISKPYIQWNTKQKGLILSGFFYGLFFANFVGGLLGSKIGPAMVFSFGLGCASFLTLVTPVAATSGFYYIFALRVIIGICEGATFPCMYGIWSHWAPPLERSRIVTISYMGTNIGTVISMPLSSFIAQTMGWQSIFYIFGVVGCAWYFLWLLIVREYPATDKNVSEAERNYIESSLENVATHKTPFPILAVLKSAPVWALIVANFVANWGYFTMMTQLPLFYREVLDFDLQNSGFLSAAPYLAYSCALPFTGCLADFLLVKGIVTVGQVRKYFTCFSFLCQMASLIIMGYVMTPAASIACTIVNITIGSFAICGYGANFLDIAPRYTSILSGLSETFAAIPGMVSPTLTGFIVQNMTIDEWRIVFYINAGIYITGAIVYWFWSSGEIQPWAKNTEEDESSDKVENSNCDSKID